MITVLHRGGLDKWLQYHNLCNIAWWTIFRSYEPRSCYKLLSSHFAFNNSSETSKSDNVIYGWPLTVAAVLLIFCPIFLFFFLWQNSLKTTWTFHCECVSCTASSRVCFLDLYIAVWTGFCIATNLRFKVFGKRILGIEFFITWKTWYIASKRMTELRLQPRNQTEFVL